MTQDRIEFTMITRDDRTASIKVFGPPVPATTDELMAAANETESFPPGATVKGVWLIIENAYLVASTDNSWHSDAVGNVIREIVNSLGWDRGTTLVIEQMPDRSTREWSLGFTDGPVDWAFKQTK